MQINITSSSQQDLEKVQQIILYYHVQLEEMLQVLKLDLTRLPDHEGKINYRVELDAVQSTGQDITIEEVQNDLQAATNRVLNRLIRMTRRGMMEPGRRYNVM